MSANMHVLHVVGARPNFMKAAPVLRAIGARGMRQTLVHTGQHYDAKMSDVFFRELGIQNPDVNLNVGSGSHAQQTAAIIAAFEPVVLERKPDIVLVYGDVNSTVAAALVCAKLGVKVAHVEAGLRSYDRTMPEEINRLVTDQLSDLLFTPSQDGNENLAHEGVAAEKIHLVGNVMIDTLVRLLPSADRAYEELARRFELKKFGLITLHRPSNVDQAETFLPILSALSDISRDLPLIFPVHPRTQQRWARELAQSSGIKVVEPLSYIEFLAMQKHATVVITDSGGIQEETTYLGTPCMTIRENTERPITITSGTNVLVGRDWDLLRKEVAQVLSGGRRNGKVPPLWEGKASERIADVLEKLVIG